MSTQILVKDKSTPVLIILTSEQLIESAKQHNCTSEELMTSATIMLSNSVSTMKEKWEFLKEVRDAAIELGKK